MGFRGTLHEIFGGTLGYVGATMSTVGGRGGLVQYGSGSWAGVATAHS